MASSVKAILSFSPQPVAYVCMYIHTSALLLFHQHCTCPSGDGLLPAHTISCVVTYCRTGESLEIGYIAGHAPETRLVP
jgi:hypothetical protein